MSGFVAVARDIIEHPLFKGEHQRLYAWQWLLCKAAWKPVPYNINGQIVTLQRGQLCASIRQLADEWGMSKSAADRFVTRLKTETMIETEAGHGKLIITICNYAKYQDATKPNRDTSGTPTGTRAGHERDIKEPVNQITKEITPLPPKGESDGGDLVEHDKLDEVGELVATWNEIADLHDLPAVRKLTDTRQRKAMRRIAEHGLEEMQQCVGRLALSPFLSGKTPERFRADFDFLLTPSKLTRLQEGFYDPRERDPPANRRNDGSNVAVISDFAKRLRA